MGCRRSFLLRHIITTHDVTIGTSIYLHTQLSLVYPLLSCLFDCEYKTSIDLLLCVLRLLRAVCRLSWVGSLYHFQLAFKNIY